MVLWRHLQRLEESGWTITVARIGAPVVEGLNPTWKALSLIRRFWWPPCRVRNPSLVKLRLQLLANQCSAQLGPHSPDAILTVLWELEARLAASLSRKLGVPLSVLMHDQEELWATSVHQERFIRESAVEVLKQASQIWPVSDEMSLAYPIEDRTKVAQLYPLCGKANISSAIWEDRFSKSPVLVHSGSLQEYQRDNLPIIADALAKVNGKLIVIAPVRQHGRLSSVIDRFKNLELVPELPRPSDVLEFISNNATGVLVSYSLHSEGQPWAKTSFPSRLVEYSQLGMPVILCAQKGTAAYEWARREEWSGHISSPDDPIIPKIINGLCERTSWIRMAEQSRKAAIGPFDPDRIHEQFERQLAVI